MPGCEMKQTMLERAVLAGVLMGDELPASLGLEERHFCDPLCRQLFTGLLQMQKDGQQIDLVSATQSRCSLLMHALTRSICCPSFCICSSPVKSCLHSGSQK